MSSGRCAAVMLGHGYPADLEVSWLRRVKGIRDFLEHVPVANHLPDPDCGANTLAHPRRQCNDRNNVLQLLICRKTHV